MKTLLYTAIYNDLYGSEYGGRPSRKIHYNYSLLNILNLKADKYLCYTQQSDIEDLKNWFYIENNISPDLLEFKIEELRDFKYKKQLDKLKNPEEIKKIDRCYEIQYNKFIWGKDIINKYSKDYEKIYWIDAGLSHSGLFPEKFAQSDTYYKYFNFSLFNKGFLDHINNITSNKIILIGKNNTNEYYWSSTLPEKYYNDYAKYNRDIHIVGGLFGGDPKIFLSFINEFLGYTIELLNTEKTVYYEEIIMSFIYFIYIVYKPYNINLLFFDDWYDRGLTTYTDKTKFFYNLFEI